MVCGGRYQGCVRDGIRSEHGRMVFPDQTVYEGLWVAGLKCGMGVLLLPDASRYLICIYVYIYIYIKNNSNQNLHLLHQQSD